MKTLKLTATIVMTSLLATGVAWAGGDAAAGEGKAANCAGCHGAAGEGMGENPPLAGLDEAAFAAAMNAFKSGERENAMMQMFAGQLSDQDIADLAAYYAGLGGE